MFLNSIKTCSKSVPNKGKLLIPECSFSTKVQVTAKDSSKYSMHYDRDERLQYIKKVIDKRKFQTILG